MLVLVLELSCSRRQVSSQLAGPIDKTLTDGSSESPDASPPRMTSYGVESWDGWQLQNEAPRASSRTPVASEIAEGAGLCWKVLPSPRAAVVPSPLSRLELLHQHHADKSVQQQQQQQQQQERARHNGGGRPHADETREELLRKLERYESARSVSQQLDFSMAPASVADDSWVSLPEGRPPRAEPGNGLAGRAPRKESPPPWVMIFLRESALLITWAC